MGPPPVPRSNDKGKAREALGVAQSVPASAVSRKAEPKDKYGLGPMPMFDTTKAEDLCGIEEGASVLCHEAALPMTLANGRIAHAVKFAKA